MENNNFFLNTYKKKYSNTNNGENSLKNEFVSFETPSKKFFEKIPEVENKKTTKISKKRLASMFLILIGVEKAKEIVKSFSEEELFKTVSEILNIETITEDDVKEVEKKFGKIENKKSLNGGKEFARLLLQNSFGIVKGSDFFVKSLELSKESNFDFLNDFVPEKIKDIIENESETIIALILGMIDSKKAAMTISLLSSDKSIKVIKKMSSKIEINKEILNVVVSKIKDKATKIRENENDTIIITGKNKLIEILKNSTNAQSESLLNELEKDNPELVNDLKESIFTFSDIVNIEKKSFEKVLKNYPDKEIAFMLKGAKEEIKTIFFTCVTKRRKEIIEDEIRILGEVLKKDVDDKRKKFVNHLKELESKGEITLLKDNEIYIE
ncbi:MAG TPA: FliG C-terminal domain-containing protein [Spirochaetota bacterium]|nr:FliG C-terminal domain-containing protein [Spirochaetota bacterium]